MKVGVQLPEWERYAGWAELATMTHRIEEAGFDSIWVGDHLLYREPGRAVGPWECWSQLAAIAAITTRVELGPLVAATSFHNPAMIAKKAVTIDEISGGRLILGLGAGWNRTEYAGFGFPFDHRVSRFEEAFTIIRTLLRDGEITHRGRFHRLEECAIEPRGPRPGAIPLMVGSSGPRMLSITLPHVEAWNAWFDDFGNRAAGLPPLLETVDMACEDVGRNPAEIERTVAVMLQFRDDFSSLRSPNPLRGTDEELAEELFALEELGIGHVQLVLDPITLESIDRAAAVLTTYRR